jgi:hypothetical protein
MKRLSGFTAEDHLRKGAGGRVPVLKTVQFSRRVPGKSFAKLSFSLERFFMREKPPPKPLALVHRLQPPSLRPRPLGRLAARFGAAFRPSFPSPTAAGIAF